MRQAGRPDLYGAKDRGAGVRDASGGCDASGLRGGAEAGRRAGRIGGAGTSRKSRGLALLLSVALALTVTGAAYAQSIDDVQGQLDDVESRQEEVENELAQVEQDIKSMTARVAALQQDIQVTTREIGDTEEDIERKEAEMAEREDNLYKRLRVMYKNGSVGFLDVLLGSNSISEFVSNLEMVQRIYKNDVDVMEVLQAQHEELEGIKADLEAKKTKLKEQQQTLASEQTALQEKKEELKAEEDQLHEDAEALAASLKALIDASSQYVGGVFCWPCPSSHYITSPAGWRVHPVYGGWLWHDGMDIGANYGADIVAAGNGKVIKAEPYAGYGNCVVIDHGGGVTSLYGHASQILVSVGQTVVQGQVIAKVGSTGVSTGPHLHFETRRNGEWVNPEEFLKG